MKIPDLEKSANDMAVGQLIEIRTKSDIILTDRRETVDQMALLWRDIATRVGPVYHYNGLATYVITKDGVGSYKLAVNNIKETELRVLVGKDAVRPLLAYIMENKRFSSKPYLQTQQWVWDDAGTMRPDLTDETLLVAMHQARAQVDLGNGSITVFAPYPHPIDDNNADVDRLLGIILRDQGRVLLFKQFLAQMLFEQRINLSGRPSMIMWGERNAGKGLLVETFIRQMMPHMCSPVPKDWANFNNFQRYKFIYLDESEANDLDLSAIYVLAKRLSGGKVDMVGGKFQEKEQTRMCNYFCAISNNKPLHMKDVPTSDSDNQWIAFKFADKLDSDQDFTEFRQKHGADLNEFVRRSAGNYVRSVLLPLYTEFAPRYRRTHRYGFPIPITSDLRELFEMSETMGDTAFWGIMQDLEAMSSDDFRRLVEGRSQPYSLLDHFREYKETGFLSSSMISFFNMLRGSGRDLTMKKVKEIVGKSKIEAPRPISYRSIGSTTCRGVKIDRDAYKALLENNAAKERMDSFIEVDLDDKLPF